MKENNKKTKSIVKTLNSRKVVPYIFVTPFVLSFLLLTLYPTIKAIIMSFQRILPGDVKFIGLNNYKRLFNSTFLLAFKNSSYYMVFTLIILVIVPLILAVFLHSKVIKNKTMFRSALFIPSLTSVIVAGTIFRLMFSESSTSVANAIISIFGISPVQWRFNAWSAKVLMIFLASWRWMGVNVIYYLAGLQNIPSELYESAEIDGASRFQQFLHITLPSLKPVMIFVSTITIIGGFRVFEESFVFWESNSPGNIGLTLIGYLYSQGIQQNDLGFGSAIGVVILVLILVVSLLNLYFSGEFTKKGAKNEKKKIK